MNQQILYTAQYIINMCGQYGAVTPMKLQKLLFYVKAWGLMEDQMLVAGPFVKWKYGPVNPDVYHAFKEYRSQPLPHRDVDSRFAPQGRQKELIDFIALSYAPFSALALSAMTHREKPWLQADIDEEITSSALQDFYNASHPFGANFPFSPEQTYVAVPSDASSAFTLDMSRGDAEKVRTFSSYAAYLDHLEQLRRFQPEADELLNRLIA